MQLAHSLGNLATAGTAPEEQFHDAPGLFLQKFVLHDLQHFFPIDKEIK